MGIINMLIKSSCLGFFTSSLQAAKAITTSKCTEEEEEQEEKKKEEEEKEEKEEEEEEEEEEEKEEEEEEAYLDGHNQHAHQIKLLGIFYILPASCQGHHHFGVYRGLLYGPRDFVVGRNVGSVELRG
jgi:hypothetical protein